METKPLECLQEQFLCNMVRTPFFIMFQRFTDPHPSPNIAASSHLSPTMLGAPLGLTTTCPRTDVVALPSAYMYRTLQTEETMYTSEVVRGALQSHCPVQERKDAERKRADGTGGTHVVVMSFSDWGQGTTTGSDQNPGGVKCVPTLSSTRGHRLR